MEYMRAVHGKGTARTVDGGIYYSCSSSLTCHPRRREMSIPTALPIWKVAKSVSLMFHSLKSSLLLLATCASSCPNSIVSSIRLKWWDHTLSNFSPSHASQASTNYIHCSTGDGQNITTGKYLRKPLMMRRRQQSKHPVLSTWFGVSLTAHGNFRMPISKVTVGKLPNGLSVSTRGTTPSRNECLCTSNRLYLDPT